ncbi:MULTISPECIES: hypothetical protein [Shouchella]|uniref:Uncharacterized protein n=1 Tax=Shouchella hunanensis TaxID=766894 RepID=A0ABY7W655_9BACI|nr:MULTISPECIES: hypothetical protein [Shouchella]WDF02205.1 hypothetical protein PQ477_11780 [Shouchella hunanensis]GAF24229.1 hypothetical protein JCM19047_4106 [Bacillus sp. JCM 19047]
MIIILLFIIVFVIVFILNGIFDALLKNEGTVKSWFVASIVIAFIITVMASLLLGM